MINIIRETAIGTNRHNSEKLRSVTKFGKLRRNLCQRLAGLPKTVLCCSRLEKRSVAKTSFLYGRNNWCGRSMEWEGMAIPRR
jgi:hypothetical protein